MLAYMLNFDDQSFNDMLTNDIVSFEQLSPGLHTAAPDKRVFIFFLKNILRGYSLEVLLMSTNKFLCINKNWLPILWGCKKAS